MAKKPVRGKHKKGQPKTMHTSVEANAAGKSSCQDRKTAVEAQRKPLMPHDSKFAEVRVACYDKCYKQSRL